MNKASIADIQNKIVEEFSFFDDRMQKYEHIIEMGKDLPGLPEEKKIDDALVKGCQSRVWLHAEKVGDNIQFQADSDAFIVRGLVSMLLRIFSDQPLKDVADADIDFIEKIGLQEMLSPTRANGLASMIKKMKIYSIAFQANDTK